MIILITGTMQTPHISDFTDYSLVTRVSELAQNRLDMAVEKLLGALELESGRSPAVMVNLILVKRLPA